jgi:hypothetical protein
LARPALGDGAAAARRMGLAPAFLLRMVSASLRLPLSEQQGPCRLKFPRNYALAPVCAAGSGRMIGK